MKTNRSKCNNRRSRKYQLTFNNPEKHKNCSHEAIKETLKKWDNILYFCMCDEIAKTPHKKYVYSVQEVRTLEKEGYTLWAMSYFINSDGPALYIMAK